MFVCPLIMVLSWPCGTLTSMQRGSPLCHFYLTSPHYHNIFFSWWNSQFNGNNQKDSSPCSHDALRPLHEAAWANMMEEAASQLERDHVHNVYDKIAPYFNDSRYKAWPKVRQFLLELQPGSIVADIGGSPAVMWSWKSNYSWLTFLVLCCSWLSCLSRLW